MERNAEYINRLARQIVQQKRQIHTLKQRLRLAEDSLSADGRKIVDESIVRIALNKFRPEGTN